MDYVGIIIPFVGGLGMFIYGMQIMAQGLENAAGNKMKTLLEVLTRNKFMGVLLGAVITAVIQSSSATTVMVVGFVNAGIMNLTQAMGVIMGANVGTTVTGWLVSAVEWAEFLSPAKIAPVAVIAGVIVMLTGKRRSTKEVSNIIIGFGLLFIGISTMSSAVAPLKQNEAFCNMFVTLGGSPLLGILTGALVTAVIQSSSASVGILQSLAGAGLVPFTAAIYIIMGQNIGTCVTAMMSSMGAKKNAKTAALMHLLFNVIGTVIFSVIAIVFFEVVKADTDFGLITQTQISTAHTAFNIATTILLFPLSGLIIKLAKKIGGVKEEEQDISVVQLDDRMLETPGIALQSAIREVERMGDVVSNTLEIAKRVLLDPKEEDIEQLREDETTVDKISAGISNHLIKLGALQISEREHQIVARLLQVVSDIERVSDYCENFSEYAETIIERKLVFSEIGAQHLKEMLDVCIDSYNLSIVSLKGLDREMALKVVEKETQADDMEIILRNKHIKRLAKGECNAEAGIIFLDAMVCLERISDHARNIAEEVLEQINLDK